MANAKAQAERCNSGHSPMLSQTNMLVRKVVETVQKAVATIEYDSETT